MTIHTTQKSCLSSLVILSEEIKVRDNFKMADIVCKKRTVVSYNNSGNQYINLTDRRTVPFKSGINIGGDKYRLIVKMENRLAIKKIIKTLFQTRMRGSPEPPLYFVDIYRSNGDFFTITFEFFNFRKNGAVVFNEV